MIKVDGRTIIMTQANTGQITFNMYGPDREALDLSAYTLTFMVKKSKRDADSDALIVKEVKDVEGNQAVFLLLPKDSNIPVGTYWWGCQIVQGDYVNQFGSGPFIISDGVINND